MKRLGEVLALDFCQIDLGNLVPLELRIEFVKYGVEFGLRWLVNLYRYCLPTLS